MLILADEEREDRPLDSDAHNLATLMLIRDHRARIGKAEAQKHARRAARQKEQEQVRGCRLRKVGVMWPLGGGGGSADVVIRVRCAGWDANRWLSGSKQHLRTDHHAEHAARARTHALTGPPPLI